MSAPRNDPALVRRFAAALESRAWWRWFDERTFERGLDYFHGGRVDDAWTVTDLGLGMALDGEVHGTGKRPYEIRVTLIHDGRGESRMVRCTCPMSTHCKHAVALLEAFCTVADDAADPGAADDAAFEMAWRSAVGRARTVLGAPGADVVERDRQLALFLQPSRAHPLPGLEVTAVWLRPSRSRTSARLVSPLPLRCRSGVLQPAPPGGWTPEFESALTVLLTAPTFRHSGLVAEWVEVERPGQVRALETLLQHPDGPVLFLERQTGPRLAPGPTLTLHTHWEADESGTRHARAALEGEGGARDARILVRLGDRLWYLDPEHGQIGPVDGDVVAAAWTRLAPPLPPQRIAWAAAQLEGDEAAPPGITAPPPAELVELEAVAPVLVLKLEVLRLQVTRDPDEVSEFGAARPSFRYGDVDVPVDDAARDRVARGEALYVLTRDGTAEAGLLAHLPPSLVPLEELALAVERSVVDAMAPLRLWVPGEGRPSRLEDWPVHLAAPVEWWPLLERLRDAGVVIETSADFPAAPRRITATDWDATVTPTGDGWFDLALDVEVDGERLPLLPLLRAALDDPTFPLTAPEDEPADATWDVPLDADRVLALPLATLRPLLAPIVDWLDREDEDAPLRLPAPAITSLGTDAAWHGPGVDDLGELARALAAVPDRLPAPPGLVGTLRDYQAEGVAWLRRTALLGVGGILADDMGLGKTVQVLAHVLDERDRCAPTHPVLLVCPTSLVANWCSEAGRFAPDLRVLHLQRPKAERAERLATLGEADLVVTTYPLLVRDIDALAEQRFSLAAFDEAQAVKNPRSKAAVAARRLDADRRIALTGTPLENHLGELWAQLDLVAPGFLGTAEAFGRRFRTPIERRGEGDRLDVLRRRIAPLLLRRTRDQVLDELPAKTETLRSVVLAGAQRDLYESLRLAQHERVREAVARRGLARSGIVVLDALLKLRQACCDPRLVKLDSAKRVTGSAKLAELRSLLATLLEENRRVLVFSQFTAMLDLIAGTLEQDGVRFEVLTGQVPGRERKARIERFQTGDAPVFLVSLKAGGVGLNLTAADTVIHYDPWWNPAAEAQATGRAHRMGQKRPVHVYRLVCDGTVEERIAALQAHKAELAASLLDADGAGAKGLTMDESELDALFAPFGAS